MSQPAYGKSYPFEPGSGQEAGNAEWRHLGVGLGGDGIVNDVAGNAFGIVASASDRTLTIDLDELEVRGIHFEGVDANRVITLSTPTSGYTRVDLIVAHYDPSDKSIVIDKHEGSAVNVGTPSAPALHRNSGGTWDLPLWKFTGGTGAASTLTKVDLRQWRGWRGVVASSAALSDVAPIGSEFIALDTNHRWARRLISGSPAWLDRDGVAWTAISLPGSRAAFGAAPAWALVNGMVCLRGAWQQNPTGTNLLNGVIYSLGTLPVGARPGVNLSFATDHGFSVGSTGARILIDTAGVITAVCQGDTVYVSGNNVRFPAEG